MKIGKFEILETVRAGFLATLYKAHDPVKNKEVALKSFECSDAEAAHRFQRELRARRTPEHANIAQAYQLGDEGNLVYVVSEWLEGEDIGRFIARKAEMSLEDKIDFMLGICEGLACVHENNIIHCDISPSNLFLLKSGVGKILDLGASSFWSSPFCRAKPDRAGESFPYRAPEQRSGRLYNAATDVFSAGLVFLEFLTGRNSSSQETRGKTGAGKSRLRLESKLPDFLIETLRKAVANEPAARYQSASEMMKALRKALDELTGRRAKMADGVRQDCGLISGILTEIKDVRESNWVQKRLKEEGIDPKLLEQIQADSSAGFASGLQYLGMASLTDELEKIGSILTEISTQTATLRQNIKGMHSRLPEINIDQAQQLLESSDDLFSSEPEAKSALEEIRIQLCIKSLNKSIADEDLATASKILDEIEAGPPAQESAKALIASAKAKLADIAVKSESLFKNAETAVDQLRKAVKQENAEQISSLLENLEYQEKSLAEQYPSSALVAKLIEISHDTRHKGLLVLTQRNCREAIKSRHVPAAKESLQKYESLCGSSPECAAVLEQLRIDIAGIEKEPAPKKPEKKPEPQKAKEEKQVSASTRVRQEPQPKIDKTPPAAGIQVKTEAQPAKEGKIGIIKTGRPEAEIKEQKESANLPTTDLKNGQSQINLETQQISDGKPLSEDIRKEPDRPLMKGDKASVDDRRLGEEPVANNGVDLEALRTRVANLFEDNPEKCLAFLDTLESQLIEDPIIQSYQKKALQSRKERSAEIILKKPKKRGGVAPQGKSVACPVCSTMNPVDSKYCAQCYALIQDVKPAPAETEPITHAGGVRAKPRLQSPTEPVQNVTTSRPIKTPGGGAAKYYGLALLALVAIGGIAWWLYNRGAEKPAPEQVVIGSAMTSAETELREGSKSIGKLPKGTQLDILQPTGTPTTRNKSPESWLPVKTKEGGKSLSGSVKVKDLEELKISQDREYTGWHALWLAEERFPNTSQANPTELRPYLGYSAGILQAYKDLNPRPELIEKQIEGYLRIAKSDKYRDEGCKNADLFINEYSLPGGKSKYLAAKHVELCEKPEPPPEIQVAKAKAPPPPPKCEDDQIEAIWRQASPLYGKYTTDKDARQKASALYKKLLKLKACTEKTNKMMSTAQNRIDSMKK